MTSVTIQLVRPHAAQQIILEADARYKVLNCGRRFGKTELFINIALNGNSPSAQGALHGLPVAYVALTYDNVLEFWRRLLDTIPEQLIEHKDNSRLYMKLVTGGIIECWTYENFPAGRGRAYGGLILDEAAQSPKLKVAWEDVFVATLLDFKGWAVIGSTPNGHNYFYDLYLRGDDIDYFEWLSFWFTSFDNPYNDRQEIERIESELPSETFEREYMASFTVREGSAFGDVESVLQCQRCVSNHVYNPGHRYVAGIDWGRDNDYTALSIINKTTDKEVYLDRWRKQRWDSMCRTIAQGLGYWHVEKATAEYNAMGQTAIEILRNELDALQEETGITIVLNKFTMTADRKTKLVDNMKFAIEKQNILLLPVDYATLELRSFVQKVTAAGKIKHEAAGSGHDDTVISRLLAWHTARNLF